MADTAKHLAKIIDVGFEVTARKAIEKRIKPIIDEIINDVINDIIGELKGKVATDRHYTREQIVKVVIQDSRKPK